MKPARQAIFFHAPCFDGIVSAALMWDFLAEARGWDGVVQRAVNYDQKSAWLALPGREPFAVVDFLYHPRATYWADHHPTTFLTPKLRAHFAAHRSPRLVYDRAAGSCSELLWHHLAKLYRYRNRRFAEAVQWAGRIDAARYRSVDEALLDDAPALAMNRALAMDQSTGFSEKLVEAVRTMSLAEIAALKHVRVSANRAASLTHKGLNRFQKGAHLDDGNIVVFDVNADNAMVSRYAPYHFFPHARYSAGILRVNGETKITAMRNPWKRFKSVPLGAIFAKVGGGGHERVGSVILRGKQGAHAGEILQRVVSEIRASDD